MRQTFELQLEAARNEVAKAQRVVANGGSDGPALAKAQAQVAQLQGELSQAQANLAQARQEVERWRNQAQVAARGLQEAHHELFARKREIDSSKQRMDALLDNLGMASEGGSQDPPSPKGQAANGRGAVGSSPAGGRGAGPGPSMRGGRVAPGKVPSASDALQRGSGVAAAGQLSPAGGGRQVKSQPPVGPPRGGGSSLAGVHLPPLPMNGGAQAGNAARNGVTVMMHNPNGAPYQPPPFNPISPSGAGKMAPQPMFGGMMMHPAFANGGAGAGSPGTRSPKATAGMGAGGDQFAYVQPKVAVATAEYVQKQRESIAQSRAAGSPGAKDRFGQGRVNAEVHLAAAKGGKW